MGCDACVGHFSFPCSAYQFGGSEGCASVERKGLRPPRVCPPSPPFTLPTFPSSQRSQRLASGRGRSTRRGR